MKRFYLSRLIIPIVLLTGLSLQALAQATSYTTPGAYVYTVPAGCPAVNIDVAGAKGGDYSTTGYGGKGGRAQADFSVTPGQVLYVYVGGAGGNSSCGAAGTSSGGEGGGSGGCSGGGAGGGAGSSVRTSIAGGATSAASLNSRIIVGGAGGGGNWSCSPQLPGGNGGYPAGANGVFGCSSATFGGNQTTGGAGSCYSGCGAAGGFGYGGNGTYFGGGGGGGWYGGGGGSDATGAGGSNYTAPGATNVQHTNGYQNGPGYVTITPLLPSVTVNPTPLAFGAVTVGSRSAPALYVTITGSYLSATDFSASFAGTGAGNFLMSLDGNVWSSSIGTISHPAPSITLSSNLKIYVKFAPGVASATVATLQISGGGLVSPVSVPLTGTGTPMCSGAPPAGTVAVTPTTGGAYTQFNMSLSGAAGAGGYTYQWQISTTSATTGFTNIPGAVLRSYTQNGVTGNTWFRVITTCPASGLSATSTPAVQVSLSGLAATSCTPVQSGTGFCCNVGAGTPGTPLKIFGDDATMSDPMDPGATPTTHYFDRTALYSVNLSIGKTYATNIGYQISTPTSNQVWIDFNNDGAFDPSESVGGTVLFSSGQGAPNIVIPSTVAPGTYRLRVINILTQPSPTTAYPAYPNINPCGSTAYTLMDARDYKVNITLPKCSGVPYAGIADASITSACQAFSTNLFNVGVQVGPGMTYQWQQSPTGSGFADILGATTPVYTPTITTTGVMYYRVKAVCTNGFGTSYTNGLPINKYDPPSTPTSSLGSFSFCTNTSLSAVATPGGGVWSTSNIGVASANSVSGFVTGTGVGTATLTYTDPSTGCYSTAAMTVNQLPSQIYAPTYVLCQGQCINISDTISGGTWNSTVPAIATVNSAGLLCAAGFGSVVIQYTLPTGCQVNGTFTINQLPPLWVVTSVGGNSYCIGNPSTTQIRLSGSTPGVKYDLILAGSIVSSLTGTGGTLNFGIQTTPGTYTVFATNLTTGCSRGMVGSQTVSISPPPTSFPVGGGGSFCAGDPAGQTIMVSNSEVGVDYELYIGGSPTGNIVSGSGGPIYFAGITTAGIYTVEAVNATTGCRAFMGGSAIVTIDPLPTAYNVLGGGNYCAGGAGRNVSLSGSIVGINYALWRYDIPTATSYLMSTLSGTGTALNFGNQTSAGTYTIVATNASTGCTNNMTGFASIGIDMPPAIHNLSGSGSYCSGGAGLTITLDVADLGVDYQLYLSGVSSGASQPGSGFQLDFFNQTAAGTYILKGTDAATGCTSTMAGSVTISINPLPTVYNMTGGGNFCVGGTGVTVGLSASSTGISYQLYRNGDSTGLPSLSGTGSALNFGLQTGAGVYTVIATNIATTCTKQMSGVATVGVNPLPTMFDVEGTGAYCSGGAGRTVSLSFSSTGVNYQLYRNGSPVGVPLSGSGAPLNFGLQTLAGTYTVKGTNTVTGCSEWMNGSAIISINPLPPVHLVTGGGNYCSGGVGMNVGLNGSTVGMTYQLMLGLSAMGSPMPGTGSPLNFGLQTLPGTYTVVATDNVTGCTKYMLGGAPVIANPLPTVFTMTGGGTYCAGSTGVNVGISGSTLGIKYQLMIDNVASGAPLSGTGSALNFGAQITPGTYTVVAKNNTTSCTSNMSGSVVVAVQSLPVAFNVTGGGSFCAGGPGVNVMLSGSDPGIDYQLYKGTTMVGSPVTGDGFGIDFGPQMAAGTYTVKATEPSTGCTGNMSSGANITINPLPGIFTVLGGGGYCAGTAGARVYLSASTSGIQYELFNGSTSMGTMTGTGSSIDFGPQSMVGSYTVVANNLVTGCSSNMASSATVAINPLPDAHNVIGGGSYCVGGSGVHVGLDGSDIGIKYQLYHGTSLIGTAVSGTGTAIDFGAMMAAGSYTVVATNISTACVSDQDGSASITINALPTAYSVTGGGNYCETGLGVHVGIGNSEIGVDYQLYHNTTPVGVALPGTGTALDLGLQTLVGMYTVSATNATTGCQAGMTGSTTINVLPILIPHVNVTPSIAGTVCVGQTVSFSASPINGGATPTYQWKVNGISAGVGSTYSYIPLNGDVVTAMITSTAQCAHPDTGSTSVRMTVSEMQMPSATVSADPGSLVCSGAPVTYTAATMYEGTAPSMQWLKNGLPVGAGSTYSYYPSNGDIITFKLESNFNCRLADVVFGNPVTMTVENPVLPVVTITSSVNHENIGNGQPVTFTATAVQAGSRPSYQWVINSTVVPGATNSTFTTSNLVNRDSVTCEVMGVCGLVGFNSVKVEVNRTGISSVTSGSDVRLVPNPNKGQFTVKGTLAASNEEVTLEVTNMLGQVIYTSKVMTQNGVINEQVKLNNSLANGMYMLNLRSGSDNTVFHFVIEQ